ncbi:MAG TPA: DinB family protein [Longimicrobiales bacterium]
MVSDRPAVQVADPFLASLLEQLAAVLLDAEELADSLTREQINWQPRPGRWSIAQCLDHLTRTASLYPEEIERMLRESRTRTAAGARPYREGWIARWVVAGMEPPPRVRIRTIRQVEPPGDLDPRAVLQDFTAAHRRLRELIIGADGVSLRHARMRSPFARAIRFTLGQVFAVIVAHARRHLWQARQVRQDVAFPKSPTRVATAEPQH